MTRITGKFRRMFIASICAVTVATGSISGVPLRAETNELSVKETASQTYNAIVDRYEELYTAYEENVTDYITMDTRDEYNDEVVTKLENYDDLLSEQREDLDYDKIKESQTYCQTVQSKLSGLVTTATNSLKNYSYSSTEYNKLSNLMRNTNIFLSDLQQEVYTPIDTFLATYEDNTAYSEQLSIIVDLQGGTYSGATSKVFTGVTGTKYGLSTPVKEGYVFYRWKVTTGDCQIITSAGYTDLVFGSKNSSIKAIWATTDGTVLDDEEENGDASDGTEDTPSDDNNENIANSIAITTDLNGAQYLGDTSTIKKSVEKGNTVVIVPNVLLLRKAGYVLKSVSCEYGSCSISSDHKLMYSAPMDSQYTIDNLKFEWQDASSVQDTKNIIRIDLNGGVSASTNENYIAKKISANSTEVVLKESDVTREEYVIKSATCSDSNATITVQNGNVILKSSTYIPDGMDLKIEWIEKALVTAKPTATPTATPTAIATTPAVVPTATPSAIPTAVPTEIPTVAPTAVPTQEPTIAPTPTTVPTAVPTATPAVQQTELPKQAEISEPVKITLSRNSYTIGQGEKVQISASATQNATITYTSENKSVCKVNSKGKITGVKPGMTQIVVNANGVTKRINVQVLLKPTKLCVTRDFKTKTTYKMKKGQSKPISIFFYKNSYSYAIRFSSSNKKVASVSKLGVIRAKGKGSCKITAKTYNGKKAVVIVKVG